MNLADLLLPDRVVVPLRAPNVMAAARTLVDRLVDARAVQDPYKLWDRVEEARPEDIVAMGDRAFLLHYRTEASSELSVALGTAPDPICRELAEGDKQCAHILLLVVAPPRYAARYLQVVGAFARFFSSAERVEAVLAHRTAESLLAMPELRETELPAELTVREMMSEQPLSTSPNTPLRDAAREMVRARIGALPVLDESQRLVGMLTERELIRDLLANYLHTGGMMRTPVSSPTKRRLVREVMTRQVLCVSPDQPLAEVASLMTNKDVDRVPVVRDGMLVGFLTRGDIVRKLIGP